MQREKDITYDEKKLQELILHIAVRSEGDPHFGTVKLNKLLFYSDFLAYMRFGRPITGAQYRKLEHGPVPSPGVQENKLLTFSRGPDLSRFSAEEIALVNQILVWARDPTDTRLSSFSHDFAGWDLVEIGEDIPYYIVLIPTVQRPLTKGEIEWGEKIAARIDSTTV